MQAVKILLAVCAIVFATQTSSTYADEDTKIPRNLEKIIENFVKWGRFNGTVLVAKGKQVLYEKGFGVADEEASTPCDPHTKFLLASVTKQFVATLVLKQIEKKALSLETPVSQFIPDVPKPWLPITIEHLLTHTSGLVDYLNSGAINPIRTQTSTPLQIIARMKNRRLRFRPGSGYRYSNTGYLMLGYILEKLTGKSWAELAKEELFAPLGMTETGVLTGTNIPTNYAFGYMPGPHGHFILPPPTDTSYFYAVGDVYSTVGDLLKWEEALFETDKVLSPALRAEMFSPHMRTYGYGVKIGQVFGHKTIWHAGHLNGHRNYLVRFPDDDLTIVVLSNYDITPTHRLSAALAKSVFDPEAPVIPASFKRHRHHSRHHRRMASNDSKSKGVL